MDQKEIAYKCSANKTHKTWSGIEGEVPATCPECGAEAELIEAPTGAVAEGADLAQEEVTATEAAQPKEEEQEEEMSEVDVAKYRITGLVDYFDEQGVIRGQLPIGSVQELPVEVGDAAVEDGRAEKVDNEETEEVE